jgi:hypothetical protein
MEDYKVFTFFINNKLVTAVLCVGSHISNQGLGLNYIQLVFFFRG